MPTDGKEYERFVYEKFEQFFVDSTVTMDDKIMGRESGVERQIDVSIRTPIGGQELLYVVQCKDRAKRPADLVILGEFSAVIRDVGAAKGFLICTSGFARSNHKYARTLGIELFTVEDIKSKRWKVTVQIPFVYIRKHMQYRLCAEIIANEELVKKNRNEPVDLNFDISSQITLDGGSTSQAIQEHVETLLSDPAAEARDGAELDLYRPNLQISVAETWVKASTLTIDLTVGRRVYLKYLTPDEYSQIRDHVRDTVLPLRVAISGTFPILDDTFVEVPNGEVPVFPGLVARAEEWTDLVA